MTSLTDQLRDIVEHSSDDISNDVCQFCVETLIRRFGDDPHRPGMKETPVRVVKAFDEYTWGYRQDPKDVFKTFEDGTEKFDEIVADTNIPIYSLCEHHLAPFFGVAHIGYIPKDGRLIGLSKLTRVTDIFAKRFQVQERLTMQIAECLMENLQPLAVGVVLQCRHLCKEMRGVKRTGSQMSTSVMLGAFRDVPSARAEFLQLVNNAPKR